MRCRFFARCFCNSSALCDARAAPNRSENSLALVDGCLGGIRELARTSCWAEAFNLLQVARENDIKPCPRSYTEIIRARTAVSSDTSWRYALVILDELVGAAVQPDTRFFNAVIHACSMKSCWAEALWLLFETMPGAYVEASVVSCNAAVTACGRALKWAFSLHLAANAEAFLVRPDRITYNASISACDRGGRWICAVQLLEDMNSSSIQRCPVSFSAAISACEKGTKWKFALNLLQEARSSHLKPDRIVFSSALSACQKGGEWELAVATFKSMVLAQIQPDVVCYCAVLSACGRAGQWELSLYFLVAATHENFMPDLGILCAFIASCGSGGKWSSAVHSVAALRAAGLDPRAPGYDAALRACEVGGRSDYGISLLFGLRKRLAACTRAGTATDRAVVAVGLRRRLGGHSALVGNSFSAASPAVAAYRRHTHAAIIQDLSWHRSCRSKMRRSDARRAVDLVSHSGGLHVRDALEELWTDMTSP